MRKLFYIFVLLLIASCYSSNYIGDEIEEIEADRYMVYKNSLLEGNDTCQLVLYLENLNDKTDRYFINDNAIIYGSEIMVKLHNIYGTYKRYMHILIFPDVDFEVHDTISF